jgi:hypothetical protein
MRKCRSCGQAITEAAAAASIFRLCFLPVRGQNVDRRHTTPLAERVGPFCLGCFETIKDLAAADEDPVAPDADATEIGRLGGRLTDSGATNDFKF